MNRPEETSLHDRDQPTQVTHCHKQEERVDDPASQRQQQRALALRPHRPAHIQRSAAARQGVLHKQAQVGRREARVLLSVSDPQRHPGPADTGHVRAGAHRLA